MQTIDQLISARWILTVDDDFRLLENHAIAVNNGLIVDILPLPQSQYQATDTIKLEDHVLMPGLINAHGHAAMTLFRGMADDYELMTWLQEYIWPAEQQYVDADFVRDGSYLAAAEMIRSGTTCFSDMYFFPGSVARVAEDAGLRAQLAFPIFDMPSNWGTGSEDYIEKGLAVMEQFSGSDLVRIAFGPHAPYTLADQALELIHEHQQKNQAAIQMHLHETAFEVETAVKEYGQRPVARMHKLGLLGKHFQAVHMTTLNESDIDIIAETGTHVIHCPMSNLKLGSGLCPVQALLDKGINVAIGTDGAASNNDLDLFSELRTAAMLAKTVAGDATALNAESALKMATINGARALGIDHITGSLKKGKSADMIAIDLSDLELQPLYHITSQLVYTSIAHRVTHSWVKGKLLMENRRLTTINTDTCKQHTAQWKEKLAHLSQSSPT